MSKGFIEYVDTEEEETTMISMTINVCIPFSIEIDSLLMHSKLFGFMLF